MKTCAIPACLSSLQLSYVNKEVNSGKLLLKLSELHSLYENRLEDLGNANSVNKTRLKKRFLEYFKEAQEQFDGRNTFFSFQRRNA